jgi:N-methylhydantoinase A
VLPFSPALPEIGTAASPDPADAEVGRRPVCLNAADGYVDTPVYDYQRLQAGHQLTGPAIIEVPTTTVVVPGGATATVDSLGNLVMQPAPRAAAPTAATPVSASTGRSVS